MNERVLSYRFGEAMTYAHKVHKDQKRKGTNIPYISHLIAVSSLVMENGGTEDEAIAALLHDAVEDQGGEARLKDIKAKFGDIVAKIVDECSDTHEETKPEWRERKEKYIAALAGKSKSGILVSLADKVHNIGTIIADYRIIGDDLWNRFKGGKEGTLWYYKSLSEIYLDHCPGSLAEEMERRVHTISRLVKSNEDEA